jgi:prepilin-type N-terminal cleavage/methylation domain-containing protein
MNDPMTMPSRPASLQAFTLIELLVVVAIMAILASLAVAAFQGLSRALLFTSELSQLAGILEEARSYAVAQNTYVWVAFYPYDPSTATPPDESGDVLFVAAFASSDGTDPLDWSAAATPVPGVVSGTTSISQILRISRFKQIAIRTENYFTSADIPSMPAQIVTPLTPPSAVPKFTLNVQGTALPSALPADAQTAQAISVIQFTPSGAARVNDSPIDSVWIDFQRARAKGIIDANSIAALRISGLTGLTTLYRK